jgi:type II secretory pathway pseudopilin PulG
MQNKRSGVTLVELIVAASISVVLLVIIAQGFRGAVSGVGFAQSAQLLGEDTRVAGNLISDYVSLSTFVYPPGTEITLNNESDPAVRNPNAAGRSNVWRIGRDSALAMLIPSEDNGGTPATFIMFYTINRGSLVSGTPAQDIENPGADEPNNNKELLYMYRTTITDLDYFANTPYPKTIPTTITSGTGRLLADYIKSGEFTIQYTRCLGFDDENQVAIPRGCPAAPEAPLGPEDSALQVEFRLQGEVVRTGKTTRIPQNPLVFQSAPRNLPKTLSEVGGG